MLSNFNFIMTTKFAQRSINTVIVGAKRTAVGTFMGGFSNMSATHLGQVAAKGALGSCNLEASEI
jgi:acetyl-CoA acetyltransferase